MPRDRAAFVPARTRPEGRCRPLPLPLRERRPEYADVVRAVFGGDPQDLFLFLLQQSIQLHLPIPSGFRTREHASPALAGGRPESRQAIGLAPSTKRGRPDDAVRTLSSSLGSANRSECGITPKGIRCPGDASFGTLGNGTRLPYGAARWRQGESRTTGDEKGERACARQQYRSRCSGATPTPQA